MGSGKGLICGVGVNNADYVTQPKIDGKCVSCPIYQRWVSMIKRCYSIKSKLHRPTYIDCYVCDEWLVFSNFKAWMDKQDWQGKELDKDLLVSGNKVYSPDTCVFVDKNTNMFANDHGSSRGNWPIGVHFHCKRKKFIAQCSNFFTKKRENLGYFDCPNAAHMAWKKRKHELALKLADIQPDQRVADALRVRYL